MLQLLQLLRWQLLLVPHFHLQSHQDAAAVHELTIQSKHAHTQSAGKLRAREATKDKHKRCVYF